MKKITKTIFVVECFTNGESSDFGRGHKVSGAPGKKYHAEFDTIEEAREDIRRIKEEFFMRDEGGYDRAMFNVLDGSSDPDSDEVRKAAEAAADKALAEFMENGLLDDDGNYYGIRAFEVFNVGESELAYILANNEDQQFTDACNALDRFDIDIDITDESEIVDESDPRAVAAEKNEDALGRQLVNARRFIEVC